MEVGYRLGMLTRLFRKRISLTSCRNIVNTAVKEEMNTKLLTAFNQDIEAGGVVPIFRRALLFPTRVALHDEFGIYTYAGLYQAASALCTEINMQLFGETGKTISYMCGNDASHIIVQWAIYMSGNIAVPLTSIHPPDMLKYFISDSLSALVICNHEFESTMQPIAAELDRPLLVTGREKELKAQLFEPDSPLLKEKPEDTLPNVGRSNEWYGNADALIIYTSGTTSKPKGVVWTHSALQTQVCTLHAAWRCTARDVVLHALPLHHVHGQLNSVHTTLAAGGRIRMLRAFSPHAVWARLLGMGEREDSKVTVFHGVPAMYARLAAEHARLFPDQRTAQYVRAALASRMRLMCAGSAPLSETLFQKWEEISGMRLLERYGMSEVGMALSNPYRAAERAAGCVGAPLPGVAARLAGPERGPPLLTVEAPEPDRRISPEQLGLVPGAVQAVELPTPAVTAHRPSEDGSYQGELLLKGPAVFTRYWNRAPKLDDSDFTADEWFRTGDSAQFRDGRFRILGRTAIDIIKSGGYKISALQVESAVLEHSSVDDVAVIGIPEETMGEIVGAVVTLKANQTLTLKDLKETLAKKLAPYQIPRTLLVIDNMPRNIMGKLDKKEIRRLFEEKLASQYVKK